LPIQIRHNCRCTADRLKMNCDGAGCFQSTQTMMVNNLNNISLMNSLNSLTGFIVIN
jgi:hypothetical protein